MTASTTTHPAPAEHAVTLGALWFGLFGAPVAWSLQLLFNYALVSHSCFPATDPRSVPTLGGLWTVVLVASVVAAAIALAAAATAWRSWRLTREEHHGDEGALLDAGEGRTRFMVAAGMLLSAIFLFGIVMNALPLLLVQPCG